MVCSTENTFQHEQTSLGHIGLFGDALAVNSSPLDAAERKKNGSNLKNSVRVWGIGLGRTGTMSLARALEILKFDPVFHNPTFDKLKIAQAATDNGATIFYKFLDFRYPNSKFILTTRDLDEWLKSFEAVHRIVPRVGRMDTDPVLRRMLLYGCVDFDRTKYIDAFRRHHEDVRSYFKDRPGDLLEMRVVDGDGWEKLCTFLRMPIPDTHFPNANSLEALAGQLGTKSDLPAQVQQPSALSKRRIRYSCVVDGAPIFAEQCLVFIWTLVENAQVSPEDIVVHFTPSVSPSARATIAAQGVRTRDISPVSADFPHLNKLEQLASPELREADLAVLCDCDLAFVRDVGGNLDPSAITASVVDRPNPTSAVWNDILSAAGLARRHPDVAVNFGEDTTLFENRNGGFYAIPGTQLASFHSVWKRWVEWLLERQGLLGRFAFHMDQVAFALSCIEQEIELATLPVTSNFPVHLRRELLTDHAPDVIHYHRHTNPSGFIKSIGLKSIDEAVKRVNAVIRKRRRQNFANEVFWDFRYAEFSKLGSGVGSRGVPLQVKREIVTKALHDHPGASILDVGSGDLKAVEDISCSTYTGVDISRVAIENARKAFPDWTFVHGSFLDVSVPPADIVLCLDVLIHQSEFEDYYEMLKRLVEATKRCLLLSGYMQPPWLSSEITFYYEPLADTLHRILGKPSMEIIGGYRDTTLLRVTPT